ncbi:hypothetical protein L3Q82_016804 [Scortum barcoo]|uniref:Uncharacterized protein n=1 Tax=Scortum barcoo TaxID=214431 RepID=A0ACB8X7Q4_9TELE|nr:hypothetical protein L3Q82_016804 [Scortum barcoo]
MDEDQSLQLLCISRHKSSPLLLQESLNVRGNPGLAVGEAPYSPGGYGVLRTKVNIVRQAVGCAKAGGVRFSEEPPATGAPSHVHFDEKLHDSVVMVTPEDDGNFMVKVGFLKTQHRYEIVFTLPEVPALGKDVCPAPVPSPHLRITDIAAFCTGGRTLSRIPIASPRCHGPRNTWHLSGLKKA